VGGKDAAGNRRDAGVARQHRGSGDRGDLARYRPADSALTASLGIRYRLLALKPSTCTATKAALVSSKSGHLVPLVDVLYHRPAVAPWIVRGRSARFRRDVLFHARIGQAMARQPDYELSDVSKGSSLCVRGTPPGGKGWSLRLRMGPSGKTFKRAVRLVRILQDDITKPA
jgi:hypothetical protein